MISIRKTSKPVSFLLLLAFTAAMFISASVDSALTPSQTDPQLIQDDGQAVIMEAGIFGWIWKGIKKLAGWIIKGGKWVVDCGVCGFTGHDDYCKKCRGTQAYKA